MEDLASKLDNLIEKDKEVKTFLHNLSEVSELVFFGGALRDLRMDGNDASPRDLDIVIKTFGNRGYVESIILEQHHIKNRFDGYKVLINDLELDVWFLEDTWAFRQGMLKPTEKNLINSVYLSMDGIAYNYNKDTLHDKWFNKTLNTKTIDTVLRQEPLDELNIVRALIFKQKYGYGLSEKLEELIISKYKKDKHYMNHLYNYQIDHYKEERISKERIKDELDSLWGYYL